MGGLGWHYHTPRTKSISESFRYDPQAEGTEIVLSNRSVEKKSKSIENYDRAPNLIRDLGNSERGSKR